jgi:hypothetical protein
MSRMSVGGGAPNVYAILRNKKTGKERIIPGHNLVTTNGDIWYAQKAGGSSAFTVVGMRLGVGTPSPAKGDNDVASFSAGGTHNTDAGYPKVSDDDADNSAYASVNSNTFRVSFGTGDANITNIREGAMVDSLSSPTKALCHFVFAANFTKTSSDTLKVFVNHNLLGS